MSNTTDAGNYLVESVRKLRWIEESVAEVRKCLEQATREIGAAMRVERKRRGLSLRALAARMGCTAQHLVDLEKGNRRYSAEWCEKALEAMKR